MLQKNNINFVSWGRSDLYTNYAWIDMDNYKSKEEIEWEIEAEGWRKIYGG